MLRRVHPIARLAANLIGLVVCVLVFDPATPLLLLGLTLAAGLIGGLVGRQDWLRMLPFVLFAAGMVWTNAAWARVPDAATIGALGPLTFTDKGLEVGLALGARVLAIAALSVTLTGSSDPTELVRGLMQWFGLSPRMGYSLMAALRFLPTIETEIGLIRTAHRVRGAGRPGLGSVVERGYRYAIPLLAGGVRHAERVALAMEARGFDGRGPRTVYRPSRWHPRDTAFVLVSAGLIGGVVAVSASMGWLVGFAWWQGY